MENPEEGKAERENSQSQVDNKMDMEISNEYENPESGGSKMLKIEDGRERREKAVLKIVRVFFLQHQSQSAEEEKERIQVDIENDAENKALKNPLVVKIIIGNLDVSCLLSCRLVNKLWLALCTEILSKSGDENDGALRISFRYCGEAGTYIKNINEILPGEIKTLDSLTEFLKKMDETETTDRFSYFPCNNFAFEDVILSRTQIQQFFQLQGSKIKGLGLSFDKCETNSATAESFTDLLINKTPNVECLTLSKIPFYRQSAIEQMNPPQIFNIKNLKVDETQSTKTNTSQDFPSFSLGKLRCLRFCAEGLHNVAQILVKEIALASPALKTVFALKSPLFYQDFNFDLLTSISKGHLITQVSLVPKVINMEILNNFAQSQGQGQGQVQVRPRPQLTDLSLSLQFVDSTIAYNVQESISFASFVPMASALLESSKETLESFYMLKGKRVVRFLKMDGFPILKNVRVVGLHCRERRGQIESPIPAKKFKRIFPNARELWLRGLEGRGILTFTMPIAAPVPVPVPVVAVETIETIETLEIQEKDVIPQITNLHLFEKFTRQFLNKIPLIFPNVVELFIQNIRLLPILPLIWRFGSTSLRLKVLTLEITIKQNASVRPIFAPEHMFPVLNFPELDAAFTGFPEEACAELLSIYPEMLEEEIVNEIRINPSILDLKYLEQLGIKFVIYFDAEVPENLLTVVSGAYAFGRMKSKLEQKLQVHVETKLEPVLDRNTSGLISKTQRVESIFKPLLPYAKMSFTVEKR